MERELRNVQDGTSKPLGKKLECVQFCQTPCMLITKEQRQQSIEKSLEKCYQPPRNKNETQFKLAHPTKPVEAQNKVTNSQNP